MDGFAFGMGLAIGSILTIYVGSWLWGRRLRRIDRHNIETMAKIKERMFDYPDPFGIPLIESDLVPDDKIYVVNPDYLYVDGKPVTPTDMGTIIMNRRSKAYIQNLKDGS